MRRLSAILGTGVFLFLAPGVVAGVVPLWITQWRFSAPWLGVASRWVGLGILLVGGSVVLDSFARFALQSLGTPAPVLPTKHLVVSGLYRYVRNPMYLGVAAAIFGQALFFASKQLLIYGGLVWLAFHLFVFFYEEPTLRATFGQDYRTFCENVPRWIPRLRGWP